MKVGRCSKEWDGGSYRYKEEVRKLKNTKCPIYTYLKLKRKKNDGR